MTCILLATTTVWVDLLLFFLLAALVLLIVGLVVVRREPLREWEAIPAGVRRQIDVLGALTGLGAVFVMAAAISGLFGKVDVALALIPFTVLLGIERLSIDRLERHGRML